MKINNHLLVQDNGESIRYINSVNQSNGIKPVFFVIHFTAGTTTQSPVNWFQDPLAKASAHLIIGRDGEVIQMVPFNKRAWHAGKSSWGNLENLNQYSIGVELVNAGPLTKRSDGKWINFAKVVVPDDQVTIAKHKNHDSETGWHEFTEIQIQTLIRVASLLNSKYQFTDILGHDDISPNRKSDPGPLFPMESFRSIVLGRA